MLLPVTLTMAAGAVFIHVWLTLRCSQLRVRDRISVGDGGNTALLARMRAHANFAENTPLFLILLGLNELGGNSGRLLWIAGILFLLARVSHGVGMDRPAPNAFRAGGMLVTLVILIGLAIASLTLIYETSQPVVIG